MPDQSILIVGAGPSGLTAAIELKRRGFHVRIVDKGTGPALESRALAINPRTLTILAPSGMSERLIDGGIRVQSLYLRSPKKQLAQVDLSALPGPYDFMLLLPQSETERLMIDCLKENGLGVERSTTLTAVVQDGGRISAELEDANGDLTKVKPDILIGADGSHSTVRHAIGQSFRGSAYEQNWGLADVSIETTLPLDGPTVFDRAPDLFAMFPIRDNRVRLISDREDVLNNPPPEILINEVTWTSAFKISHRLVDSYQSDNVFLVGDAAHIHSPFGGRGMNLGIEDAAWLAWLIAEGDASGFTAARRPVAENVIKTVDPGTRFMASDALVSKFVRRTLIPVLASLPMVQRRALPVISASNTPFPPWLHTD